MLFIICQPCFFNNCPSCFFWYLSALLFNICLPCNLKLFALTFNIRPVWLADDRGAILWEWDWVVGPTLTLQTQWTKLLMPQSSVSSVFDWQLGHMGNTHWKLCQCHCQSQPERINAWQTHEEKEIEKFSWTFHPSVLVWGIHKMVVLLLAPVFAGNVIHLHAAAIPLLKVV